VLGHSLRLAELCHGAGQGRAGARRLDDLRALDPGLATLDEALELLASAGSGRRCLIDLKAGGFEQEVGERLRAHRLVGNALVCSLSRRSLRTLAVRAPEIRRSISYPRDRFEASRRPLLAPLVPLALALMRRTLSRRLDRWLGELGAAAATIQHTLVSAELVERCHRGGAAVIAWTVDDGRELARLIAAGADGIICNDPGLVARTLS
jgi:glycerophosphoryl diester phosphodiesterase